MLHGYFGDKSAVYGAALREAYVWIRQAENALKLDAREPEDAIRTPIRFTITHFRDNPWFIRMPKTKNLLGGKTVRDMRDASDIQSVLLDRLQTILDDGRRKGLFRQDITAADLYIMIAALCWFPISNMHTLRATFRVPIGSEWLSDHAERSADMVGRYLRVDTN
ncbi:MAG: hypothetical protein LJE62_10930 [Silicimonas sp.]|nr:hypothetical protein [Silicimonas sp.]